MALVAFDSCADTLAALKKAAAEQVGPYGLGNNMIAFDAVGGGVRAEGGDALGGPGVTEGRAAAQPPGAPAVRGGVPGNQKSAADHSTTNTHEAGVDEPDLVKTDGRRMVVLANNQLRVVDLTSRKLTGKLELAAGPATDLLLQGDRALVLSSRYGPPWYGKAMPDGWSGQMGAQVTLIDVAGTPRVLSTLSVNGSHVDARQVGSVARIVVRSAPHLPFLTPDAKRTTTQATQENRRILARSTVDQWLPSYELSEGGTQRRGRLVECEQVSHAQRYAGTSMLTVLTFDLGSSQATLTNSDAVSVVADGNTVYANGTSLYVVDDRRFIPVPMRPARPLDQPARPETPRTEVHKFDISGSGKPRYVASGEVEGGVLNQYSLSEHDGHLRVATTTQRWDARGPADESQSAVTVLAQRGRALVQVGKVDGLGKGEQIYAVRFIGPVGYVVTFRQTDPLYTLDLSDPRRPRVAGELKITGYSAYLHPAGDGRLIGVGQEATTEGRRTGTQVSLFDVSNPDQPRRLDQHQVRFGASEVESDPHAFLYWPKTGLLVVPVTGPQVWRTPDVPLNAPGATGVPAPRRPVPPLPQNGALVLRLSGNSLSQVGTLSHPVSDSLRQVPCDDIERGFDGCPVGSYRDGRVRRALVVGDTLWTVSAAGVLATDERTLARQAWLPFD